MENAYVLQLSDQKFQDLYLCFCGYAKCEPLHSFGPAVRPNYILHYILEGVVSESNCTEKKIADSVYQIWRKSGQRNSVPDIVAEFINRGHDFKTSLMAGF